MENTISFNDILEYAEMLSTDEQETLIDILHKRLIEHRRNELFKEVCNAQKEYEQGLCKTTTPSELMKEILS